MKHNKATDEFEDVKEVPGLFTVRTTYKISDTKASLDYCGPPIPSEVWSQILSFFHWTNSEHHSESQVRWYVNTKERTWRAWAYPQEERTSMSARELGDTDEFKEQRAQFNDDWVYYGTVHHHCGGSAFQSGVDENNEKGQDGLHITVGNMDKDHHTIHCRLYNAGMKYENLNMSMFWNIGEELKRILPVDLWDRVARHQMCIACRGEFPEQWRKNVIPAPKIVVPRDYEPFRGAGFSPATPGQVEGAGKKGKGKAKEELNGWERALVALKHILKDRSILQFQDEDVIKQIEELCDDQLSRVIIDECVQNSISISLLGNRVKALLSNKSRTKAIPEHAGDMLGELTDEEAADLLWGPNW